MQQQLTSPLDLHLHLLQPPAWNHQLWATINQRIEAPVAHLDAPASLASREPAATGEATHAETVHISKILAEQGQALRS